MTLNYTDEKYLTPLLILQLLNLILTWKEIRV